MHIDVKDLEGKLHHANDDINALEDEIDHRDVRHYH